MKIKFLEPLSTVSGSYGVGEIVELDDRRATNYINAGWAEQAEDFSDIPEKEEFESFETTESKIIPEKAIKNINPKKGIKPLRTSDGKKTATSKADEIGLKNNE